MKLFQRTLTIYSWLGVDLHPSSHTWKKLTLTYFLYFAALVSSFASLLLKSNTFMELTNNIFLTSSVCFETINFSVIVFKQKNLFDLFRGFERFIDEKSKNPASKKLYDEVGQLIEKWSDISIFIIGAVTPTSWILPKAIYSYVVYFTTDLGNDAFHLPIPCWVPFDWSNPRGYLAVVSLQQIVGVWIFMFCATLICIGAGSFLFVYLATNDLKADLKLINELAKDKHKQPEAMDRLSDFIRFYSDLKQFFQDFSKIFQLMFMVLSIWSLAAICGVMLLCQMGMQRRDSEILYVMLSYAFYAFGTMFFICELCQRLSNAFEEICEQVETFDWNLYPFELQKLMPMVLIGLQPPVEVECFGGISSLRETFKKVVDGGYSYFMVMRKFV